MHIPTACSNIKGEREVRGLYGHQLTYRRIKMGIITFRARRSQYSVTEHWSMSGGNKYQEVKLTE